MALSNTRFSAQHLWWPENSLTLTKLEPALLPLISSTGSLTQALVDLSDGNFSVKLLSQGIVGPKLHEQIALGYPLSRAAIVREVELQLYGESVVFARSIIPLTLAKNSLANLGAKPLGHLLFKDGKIRVSKRQYSEINIGSLKLNARRTPYDYQGAQILVSEFFLPKIYDYCI